MKSLLQLIAIITVMGIFLCLGLWLGPQIRSTYDHWFPRVAFVTGGYSALYSEAAKHVVVFTASTCIFCKHARELLAKENVDYYDFVTDQSTAAQKRYATLG